MQVIMLANFDLKCIVNLISRPVQGGPNGNMLYAFICAGFPPHPARKMTFSSLNDFFVRLIY